MRVERLAETRTEAEVPGTRSVDRVEKLVSRSRMCQPEVIRQTSPQEACPAMPPPGCFTDMSFAALAWSGFDNPKKRRAEGIGLDDSSILERVAAGLVHF